MPVYIEQRRRLSLWRCCVISCCANIFELEDVEESGTEKEEEKKKTEAKKLITKK